MAIMEAKLKEVKLDGLRGLSWEQIAQRIDELEAREGFWTQQDRDELGGLYAMLSEFQTTYG